MLEQQLRDLVQHWQALAAEAKQQSTDIHQSPLLRGHAFGVYDGLMIAAEDLDKLIKANTEESASS